MGEVKHTPGPWYGDQETEDWRGMPIMSDHRDGMVEICTIALGFDEPFESEQLANARLIAAAPDMLEALRELHRWFRKYPEYKPNPEMMEDVQDAINRAGEVIAKAELSRE